MKKLPVSLRYARALSDMAYQDKIENNIMEDIEYILQTISSSKELGSLIKSPIISNQKKKSVLTEIFSSKITKLMLEFLNLLVTKGREVLIWDIFDNFKLEYYEKHNILPVIFTSAYPFDDELKALAVEKLKDITKKTILPEYKIEKNIIGGFKIQFNDILIDSSIRTKINNLQKQLLVNF